MPKYVWFERLVIVKRTGPELVLIATAPKSCMLGVMANGVGDPVGVGVGVPVEVDVAVGVGEGEWVGVGVNPANVNISIVFCNVLAAS